MSATDPCCYSVVGVMVWHHNTLLMFERNTLPPGIACPAGHIDDHGTHRKAALVEVQEEVGITLDTEQLHFRAAGYLPYKCRRQNPEEEGGHTWFVYEAQVEDAQFSASERETKNAHWYTRNEVRAYAESGKLEPAWLHWLTELGIV